MNVGWVALALAATVSGTAPEAARRSALELLSDDVAREVLEAKAEGPVALAISGSNASVGRAFATSLAAALAEKNLGPVVLEVSPSDAEARARAAGARSLLRLELWLERDLLHARGELFGTWVNFWSGQTATRPPTPARALDASVRADPFVTSLLAPADAPPTSTARRFVGAPVARLAYPVVALASGDLDRDGRAEWLTLGDDELSIYGGDGAPKLRRDLRPVPLSLTPSREPFGLLGVLDASGEAPRVRWWNARRQQGELLQASGGGLVSVAASEQELLLAQATVGSVTAKPVMGTNGAVFTVGFAPAAPPLKGAFSSHSTRAVGFGGLSLLLTRSDGTGVALSSLDAPVVALRGLGSGAVLVDLAGDGRLAVATGRAEYAPTAEELRVLPLSADGNSLFTQALPRGQLRALAAGNADGEPGDELLAAVVLADGTTELWLFRGEKVAK